MYVELTFSVEGIVPLIMHNVRLANPGDPITRAIKAITAKRQNQTDADIEERNRLEFLGALYLDSDGAPCVPGEVIEGGMYQAAKKKRWGVKVQTGVISDGNWPLLYDGPRTAEALWDDGRFLDVRAVVVERKRVMRCRPIFPVWRLDFTIHFRPDVLNAEQIIEIVKTLASDVGLCDYRPRYGRFQITRIAQNGKAYLWKETKKNGDTGEGTK